MSNIFRTFAAEKVKNAEMRKSAVPLFLILCLAIFTGCSSHEVLTPGEREACRDMCVNMRQIFPSSTLQDVYKTCYQDFFGAEHLLVDTAAARRYLHEETERCKGQDLSTMPLYEPTGFRHRYRRVNLMAVIQGDLSEEELWEMFSGKPSAVSSQPSESGHSWAEEWQAIEAIALKENPQWADETLQVQLREAAAQQAAVHHSRMFRDKYNPHYRIVTNNNSYPVRRTKAIECVSLLIP